MKRAILTFLFSVYTIISFAQPSLSDFVNPLMGTLSKYELSNGNTYPAVAVPWGMNLWSPQTGEMGNGWMYRYDADKIRGFKQTHQPSPWMNDYGQFSIMPVSGGIQWDQNSRASWFSHKAETSTPYWYKVYLADHDITAEFTPTERAAQFAFTFPKGDSSTVVIDAFDRGSYIKIIPGEKKVIGYTTRYARGKLVGFKNYFVAYFDKAFDFTATWAEKELSFKNESESKHSGAVIGFKTNKGEKVHMKIASSFISFEQAELNLKRELGKDKFEQTKQKAKALWDKGLGRIQVEGGTDAQIRTFYSCMYRTMLFPHKMYEIDAAGNVVHYSPYNGKTLPGYRFAGTGFWDTFRALYPFLNLVFPSINKEMQQGLVNDYKEGGWLPEWSSPAYSDIMIGNNSASVVADAYVKGLRGYDIETLYEALVHGANNEGPISAIGRKGVDFYNKLGYVPADSNINESVARTLEYAYEDYCIYKLGTMLGKPKSETDIYRQRAMNYIKLFDAQTKLMRPRNLDGSFQKDFNPVSWGGAFTEGNSWHYSWSVFQDIAGLKNIMGGDTAFVAMLDSVFAMPPLYESSYYGGIIHEIKEMQIINMGQYAHGNQPIQHMVYLYNYAGAPWKSQYWAREIMNRLYVATPDGYCGDEDNGQTSAWYVFSALGFYPVTPATDQYVVGAPLFRKATITLENGKKIVINAPANSNTNRYISSVTINGKPYGKNWLTHSGLMNGAFINILMSNKPTLHRGMDKASRPFSLSEE